MSNDLGKYPSEYACVEAGFDMCNFCEAGSKAYSIYSLPYRCWIDFFEDGVSNIMKYSRSDMIEKIITWKTHRYDQKSLVYLDYVLNKRCKDVLIRIEKINILR